MPFVIVTREKYTKTSFDKSVNAVAIRVHSPKNGEGKILIEIHLNHNKKRVLLKLRCFQPIEILLGTGSAWIGIR